MPALHLLRPHSLADPTWQTQCRCTLPHADASTGTAARPPGGQRHMHPLASHAQGVAPHAGSRDDADVRACAWPEDVALGRIRVPAGPLRMALPSAAAGACQQVQHAGLRGRVPHPPCRTRTLCTQWIGILRVDSSLRWSQCSLPALARCSEISGARRESVEITGHSCCDGTLLGNCGSPVVKRSYHWTATTTSAHPVHILGVCLC